MSTASPPKPWELAEANTTSTSSATLPFPTAATTTSGVSSSTSGPPALPSRPSALNSVVNQTASNYTNYGASRLGTSAYGGYGGYSSYSSPYSRFGGMGGMYGGYGGMYGGGMYGGGMGVMPGNLNDPNSLTNSFNHSTQATFQIIESIVGAFGGFAQMLESTYMATHSSFFAMVSVAEQFGNLRNTLGSVLGIFTLLRWLRTLVAKLSGRPPPADAAALTPSAFASFLSGNSEGNTALSPTTLPDGTPVHPRPSKKPFIVFVLAVFGLPYLMGKLIRALARSQEVEEARRRQQQEMAAGPNGRLQQAANQAPIDPTKLDFCRVLYDYNPVPQSVGIDIPVKKGDLVAVLSKTDPLGNPSEWWRCRTKDGGVGYLPSPYLEIIQRRQPAVPLQGQITATASTSAPGSRTATLRTLGSSIGAGGAGGKEDVDGERTTSLAGVGGVKWQHAHHQQKPKLPIGQEVKRQQVGDVSVENFQKSAFYS